MTVEVALLISMVSVAFAVYFGLKNVTRNNKTDTAKEASEMTTVVVKLENIASGISEIKSDIRNTKNEVQTVRDRLIIVEERAKSAHKRLDDLYHEQEAKNS